MLTLALIFAVGGAKVEKRQIGAPAPTWSGEPWLSFTGFVISCSFARSWSPELHTDPKEQFAADCQDRLAGVFEIFSDACSSTSLLVSPHNVSQKPGEWPASGTGRPATDHVRDYHLLQGDMQMCSSECRQLVSQPATAATPLRR